MVRCGVWDIFSHFFFLTKEASFPCELLCPIHLLATLLPIQVQPLPFTPLPSLNTTSSFLLFHLDHVSLFNHHNNNAAQKNATLVHHRCRSETLVGFQKEHILISGCCCLAYWVIGKPFIFYFLGNFFCLQKMGSSGSKATSSCSSSSCSGSFRKGRRSKGRRGFPSYCLGTTSGSRDTDNDDQVTNRLCYLEILAMPLLFFFLPPHFSICFLNLFFTLLAH